MLITSNMDRPDYVGQDSREGIGAERLESKRHSVSTGTYSREALHCETKWYIDGAYIIVVHVIIVYLWYPS